MGSYNLHFRKYINFPRKKTMTRKIKKAIIRFYEEDENSRMTPGKRDFITFQKVRKQKRFLNDSLKNLYSKFCFKEKRFRVSYAFFCRLTPFWVLIPSAASRQTCLCAVHEHVRLLVSKLKVLNIKMLKARQTV
nr:unnamed protein product [Callosobruchus analis]